MRLNNVITASWTGTVNYPFGSVMYGRSFSTPGYRYGFNGKEKDDEIQGENNTYDFNFRLYNTRLARFLSVDPLFRKYSELTTYQFAGNDPILNIDLEGLEAKNSQNRSLSESEISTLFAQGGTIGKLKLLSSLSKESQSKIIVVTGEDIAKVISKDDKLKSFRGQVDEIKKINRLILSKGKLIVQLKEGNDKIKIALPKGAKVIVENYATLDANGLSTKDKQLAEYKTSPIVTEVSGSITTKGVSASFLGIEGTPETITFKSKLVTDNKSSIEKGKTYSSFDVTADIHLKESYLPDAKDKAVDFKILPEKKK